MPLPVPNNRRYPSLITMGPSSNAPAGTMTSLIAVTGGLGFIGSAFVRMLANNGREILNLDLVTYAGDTRRLPARLPVRTQRVDVADKSVVDVLRKERPETILHFAAETHVTRSEHAAESFFRTNVEGTKQVLTGAEVCGATRVIHVSTDEVYGPCEEEPFTEDAKLPGRGLATSPYAQSKAIGDDVALSFSDRIPVIVARPTNCFGPWQHPEKAVPRWTIRAITGRRLPVWGDGRQVRDWMFVDDACRGLEALISWGEPGQVYNLGPGGPQTNNLEIARLIASLAGQDPNSAYRTEYDRPQHDRRYAVDCSKVRALGWSPQIDLEEGLLRTIAWYGENREWWRPLLEEAEGLYEDQEQRRDISP